MVSCNDMSSYDDLTGDDVYNDYFFYYLIVVLYPLSYEMKKIIL
jgi:hypothetical protein